MPSMKRYQDNHSREGLRAWRAACEWLDAKPGKHSYGFPPVPSIRKGERPDGLIFYSSGWGWRLHRGWKERLNELERIAPLQRLLKRSA